MSSVVGIEPPLNGKVIKFPNESDIGLSKIDKHILKLQEQLANEEAKRVERLQNAEKEKHEYIEKLKVQRAELLKASALWEQKASVYKSKEDIDGAFEKAYQCKIQADEIARELPNELPTQLNEVANEVAQVADVAEKRFFSTTKSVLMLAGLFVLTGILFFYFGTEVVAADPMNDSMKRMMNSTGYRMILNVMLWAGCVLVAVSYLYFFHGDLWAWFHNRIDSKVSFYNDFLICEPSERLKFFTQNFWAAAFLFAVLLLVIMG